jgi:bile acid-coenzyme A ligase
MHAALFVGGHVVEMGRFDPLRALELIERHRVEWVNLVPTMMNRIWRLPEDQRKAFDLSSLRTVFHMASACPPWLKERWIEWLGPERIWELYGGTERQGSTVIGGAEWLTHRGSVGRVQPGSRMQVLNEAGEPCAPGEVGEVFFLPDLGAGATYHYVGADPKRQGEWESIGDLGYLDEEGYLYLVDRRTDMIVSGGANVYPAEVEAALDAHPGIASSAVIGLPDDDLGQRVHAIVQASPTTGAPDLEELRSFLAERLVRYKIPRSFEIVEEPLRDDAGKTRRSALREARLAGSPRG